MSGTEIVALVRDVAFITLFLVMALTGLVLFWRVTSILRSLGRAAESMKEIAEAIPGGFVKQAARAAGFGSGAEKAGSILGRLRRKG